MAVTSSVPKGFSQLFHCWTYLASFTSFSLIHSFTYKEILTRRACETKIDLEEDWEEIRKKLTSRMLAVTSWRRSRATASRRAGRCPGRSSSAS